MAQHWSLKHWGLDARAYAPGMRGFSFLLGSVYFVLAFLAFAAPSGLALWQLLHRINPAGFMRESLQVGLAYFYLVICLLGFFSFTWHRRQTASGNLLLVSICFAVFLGTLLSSIVNVVSQMLLAGVFAAMVGGYFVDHLQILLRQQISIYLGMVFLLVITSIMRWRFRVYQFSVQRQNQDTSSHLGAAQMASLQDIARYGLRAEQGGLIGKDAGGYLRLPKLTDRLILAYRGGGKTAALLVPGILDYLHVNKFITDIKGELSAITAGKALATERTLFIIDPFSVLKSLGLNLPTRCINPLAGLEKADALTKDRLIAALAGALSGTTRAKHSETEAHFHENAQIILEGLIDFYVTEHEKKPEKLNLVEIHDWWLQIVSDPKVLDLERMKKGSQKARAAASQMLVAGKDESGSMKTTIYRQLQWLRSENIRQTFIKNEVDLNIFATGDCDIYVVLPEDMIKAHASMVRVVLALVKVKLLQTPAHQLKTDYCLMLDELGQFGYSPDVEQVINTMRSRGVKVWASFQTLEQIEAYRDESVFKGMPVKHFLGSDDIKTLEWIQKLGDKTTVLTENVSRSRSKNLAQKGGGGSASESYGVSETATHLIQIRDVREMPADDQYVFIRSMRPIRCQKAYYFKEPTYAGRYDENPLETRGKTKHESQSTTAGDS